jgi:hypothetical protein
MTSHLPGALVLAALDHDDDDDDADDDDVKYALEIVEVVVEAVVQIDEVHAVKL